MSVTPANASYVSSEVIGTFAFDEFFQAPGMMPMLFEQKMSASHREVSGSMSGLGDFQVKQPLASPSTSDPTQQFDKEFIHAAYSLESSVARETVDDQRFPFFQEFGLKIGQSAQRTTEKLGARVFNNAFTTTYGAAEDGLALCHTAHLNADGGNSQGNDGSTAFSNEAVTLTRTLMRAFTDYSGNVIEIEPDAIMVSNSSDNEAKLFEVLRSNQTPDNANNAANFNQGRYQGYVWRYLTDTNNWFMMDTRLRALNLFWYWRIVLEIFGDGDLFTGRRRVGGYFRSSHGAKDWRWIYGHEVA